MVRWGVMSPGSHLDTKIVPAMKSLPDTEVVAVFSRSQQRADEFAESHDIPLAYDSIESFGKPFAERRFQKLGLTNACIRNH